MKAKSDVSQIAAQVMQALAGVRAANLNGDVSDDDRAVLETYCSMSLEVLSTTNPRKLSDAFMKAELRRRIPPSPIRDTVVI